MFESTQPKPEKLSKSQPEKAEIAEIEENFEEKKAGEKSQTAQTNSKNSLVSLWQKPVFRWPFLLLITLFLLLGIGAAALFSTTPGNILRPVADHYHFRMQVLVNGTAEDFGQKKYQAEYKPGQCSVALTEEPIHFHDGKDQVVHIHWSGVTGGQVLKFYGWNYMGGVNDALGWRGDRMPFQKVPTLGQALPQIDKQAKFWVYTGDKAESGQISFQKKEFQDFVKQDLEDFFDKESLIRIQQREVEELEKQMQKTSHLPKFLPNLFPEISALAHGEIQDGHSDSGQQASQGPQPSKEELEKINNLLGNVVIFVQNEEPNKEQTEARFNNLAELENSTCGG